MVHSSDIGVFATALFECRTLWRTGIAIEVMKLEDFREMGHVVLAGPSRGVIEQVGKWGDGSTVVEGAVAVRRNDQQMSSPTDHPAPFAERADRVRQMLQDVRGQHQVVRFVRYLRERSGLADQSPPQWHHRLGVIGPQCLIREIEEIECREMGVDWDQAVLREDFARPAEL